jgi:hypothetical protein
MNAALRGYERFQTQRLFPALHAIYFSRSPIRLLLIRHSQA